MLKRLTERGRRWREKRRRAQILSGSGEWKKKGRLGRREQLARDKKHGRKGKTTSYYSN